MSEICNCQCYGEPDDPQHPCQNQCTEAGRKVIHDSQLAALRADNAKLRLQLHALDNQAEQNSKQFAEFANTGLQAEGQWNDERSNLLNRIAELENEVATHIERVKLMTTVATQHQDEAGKLKARVRWYAEKIKIVYFKPKSPLWEMLGQQAEQDAKEV